MTIAKRGAVAARHLVVVAYDVISGRRRGQIAAVLLGFGERVQKSVFECRVSERERERMEAAIRPLLGPRDCVRYYAVCAACEGRVHGVPAPAGRPPSVVLA